MPSLEPKKWALMLTLAAAFLTGCSDDWRSDPGSVRESPAGISYNPRQPTPAQEERIRIADSALARAPDDTDCIVEAALAREDVWRYEEAIQLYTRGLEIDQADYRLYLGRAHRLIRFRRLEQALRDLDESVRLDPYGFNSAYLRGLTYYLMGRFQDAAEEYGRCIDLSKDEAALKLAASGSAPGDPRSCMVIASDDASKVAISSWRYRALRRAGREREAADLLTTIPEDLILTDAPNEVYRTSTILPGDNTHYYMTLLLYKGSKGETDILNRNLFGEQWATVAYGAAVWRLVEGNREGAIALMREIVAEPHWARFAHVAAEMDLIRLGAIQ
jgi:tetratricopeptide (TPR) repeat protein